MSSRTIVLSTPEIREMLAALDALGGPEALEATGALLEARHVGEPLCECPEHGPSFPPPSPAGIGC